jgi:hypothetical protein
MRHRLVGYGSLSLLYALLGESVPMFSAMPRAHGGLAMSSAELAIPLAFGGLWLMISSSVLYPRVHRCIGSRMCALSLNFCG